MDLDIKAVEEKWKDRWYEGGIFEFKKQSGKGLYSIDTPPPTVSGALHMGHAFSYPHQDFVARYRRMRGYRVLYPWGLDDNGLPTERYVEKVLGKRGSRENLSEFNAECFRISTDLEKEMTAMAMNMGLSADFRHPYRTVERDTQRISQKLFLDLLRSGTAYRARAPSYWCPTCGTAISQSELKNKTKETDFVDIEFRGDDGNVVISTTRPELLFACVAIAVNPSDERYRPVAGSRVRVPIAGYEVPVIKDESVVMDKGTGAEMVCTFGDQNDLEIWKKFRLPLREIVGEDGRMNSQALFLSGLRIGEARKTIISRLESEGYLKGSRKIVHTVNAHERCDTPVEISISTQWFVKSLDLKEDLIKRGREILWKPDFMRIRYENWVNGLRWDWCISRQRFYGIPFPVWYCRNCGSAVLPKAEELPVDPRLGSGGRKCEKCGSGDLVPDTDVMDTWATSSLTPDIAMNRYGLGEPEYPFSCRFQAHDIISTWAFTTILRAHLNHSGIPWREISISGNVTDPEGKKMSKSKGNALSPSQIIEKYGSDALRYWSASVSPWEDVTLNDQELVRGRRLVVKIHNVARLLSMLADGKTVSPAYESSAPYDSWILNSLKTVASEMTSAMEDHNFYRGRLALDTFFWGSYCDNYLEILKSESRAGKDPDGSSLSVAYFVFLTVLKLYAPIMPFITEEVYSNLSVPGKLDSLHMERWPDMDGITFRETDFENTLKMIAGIRSIRSSRQIAPSATIPRVAVRGPEASIKRDAALVCRLLKVDDLVFAGSAQEISVET